MAAGTVPVDAVVDGVLLIVAAPLLMTPGFITDALGFALLTPPIRRLIAVYALDQLKKRHAEGRITIIQR